MASIIYGAKSHCNMLNTKTKNIQEAILNVPRIESIIAKNREEAPITKAKVAKMESLNFNRLIFFTECF